MKKEVKKKELQKKEVGFITILNIVVGVILTLFCLINLFSGLFLTGILFLALAVFIFLPQKILKFSKWLKLLIGIIGFFVVLIIIGLQVPSQELDFEYHSLNEDFILSYNKINISMVVYNATKEDTILLNDEEKTTTGIFIKINVALTNLEKLPVNFGAYVGMADSQNNSYEVLGYNLGDGSLQPNLKKEFYYIFETPEQATGLKFIITQDNKHFKEIDLEI